jgi:hypothetical protein
MAEAFKHLNSKVKVIWPAGATLARRDIQTSHQPGRSNLTTVARLWSAGSLTCLQGPTNPFRKGISYQRSEGHSNVSFSKGTKHVDNSGTPRSGQQVRLKAWSTETFKHLISRAIAQDWLCAVGHIAGCSYLLWAVAKDLVNRNGPWNRIWFCAVGHSAKPITIAQNHRRQPILKACHIH